MAEWLKLRELAAREGVSRSTLWRWVERPGRDEAP